MKKLTVLFNAKESDRFPVYYHASGDTESRKAFISLDCEALDIDAIYSDGTGMAEVSVHNECKLLFPIPPCSHSSSIEQAIKENMENFQKIVDGCSIEHSVTNQGIATYSDEAKELIQEFSDKTATALIAFDDAMIDYDGLEDFVAARGIELTEETDVYEVAKTLIKEDGEDNCWLSDELADIEDLKKELLELKENCL